MENKELVVATITKEIEKCNQDIIVFTLQEELWRSRIADNQYKKQDVFDALAALANKKAAVMSWLTYISTRLNEFTPKQTEQTNGETKTEEKASS